MTADEADFGTEMRGYKKDEVDRAVLQLRAELMKASTDRSDALKEVKRLLAVNEDLQAELDESGSPTYAGLGTKLENMLRVAEEQSTRLISQADIDAERMRTETQAEVTALRAQATQEAQRVLDDANLLANKTLADARDEAESLLASSRAEAETVNQNAVREAAGLRAAAGAAGSSSRVSAMTVSMESGA